MLRYLLVIISLLLVTQLTGKHLYTDYTGFVGPKGIDTIQKYLSLVDQAGLDIYAASLGKAQRKVGYKEVEKKRTDYDLVLYTYFDTDTDQWSYEVLTNPQHANLHARIEIEMGSAFSVYTDGATKMSGVVIRDIFKDVLNWAQQSLGAVEKGNMTRQTDNQIQAWPYLPTTNTLANKIAGFGNMIDNRFGNKWKNIRRVNTSKTLQAAGDYDLYLASMVTFAKELRDSVKAMSDYIENRTFPTMYPKLNRDLSKPIASQVVHLHSGGHDWWETRYFESARRHFASALSYGTIPQMLEEIAALEYSIAFQYLDWVYQLAGKKDLLQWPMVKANQKDIFGSYKAWEGYNEYTFYGIGNLTAGFNIPVGLARIAGGSKNEIQYLKYNNSKIDLEWEMFIACSSAFSETAVGVGTDFILPSAGASINATPPSDNYNNSSTKAYHYYPPIFFNAPLYNYHSAKGAANLGMANVGDVGAAIDMTIAGEIQYTNAGRILGLSAAGLNLGTGGGGGKGGSNAPVSANVQAVVEVGAGSCYAYDLRYTKPLKSSLDRNTAIVPVDVKDHKIVIRSVGFPSIDPALDANDNQTLSEVVRDIKLFRQSFPERILRVEIQGMSAGVWNHNRQPPSLSAADSAGLTGLNKEVYANYFSAKFMAKTVTEEINRLIDADTSIKRVDAKNNSVMVDIRNKGTNFYENTITFEEEMRTLFNQPNTEWNEEPRGFRQVVISLISHE